MIIDFHAHILPGLDHGCRNKNEFLSEMSGAMAAKVECIVASSHFYPHSDNVESYLNRRQAAWDYALEMMPENAPDVIPAAEVLVCEGMEKMDGLSRLMFGNNVILLEMPTHSWNHSLVETVCEINDICGGNAVLAHVDRYNPKNIDILFSLGLYGQLNVSNICRISMRRQLMSWVKQGKIVAIGSDVHNSGKIYRKFTKAISLLGKHSTHIMDASADLLETSGITALNR